MIHSVASVDIGGIVSHCNGSHALVTNSEERKTRRTVCWFLQYCYYGHLVMMGMIWLLVAFSEMLALLLFSSPLGSSCWNDLFERYLQLQQNQHSKRIGRKNCSDRRSPPLATPYSVSVRIQWIRISRRLACRLDGMVWCCMVGLCQRWAWMASQ